MSECKDVFVYFGQEKLLWVKNCGMQLIIVLYLQADFFTIESLLVEIYTRSGCGNGPVGEYAD